MPEPSQDEILDVAHEFLLRYAEEARAGTSRSLPDYQALYPGFEDVIEREYAVVTGRAENEQGTPPPALSQLGPYRILGELGHGGQGLVYLAEDTRLQRRVALKVLSLGAPLSARQRSRFQREAEAASRLDHPGICTVYEAGEADGTPFFAMRFVEGETLAARLARERAQGVTTSTGSGRSSGRHRVNAILALFEQLADALHFAHEHGVVHRDVKPGNIMIEPSGQPVLLDFGLAHPIEDAGSGLTLSGDLLGTPAYMAPEQVAGRGDGIDRRTDVHALAVTMFEALTTRRPFDAESRESLYRQILSDAPPSARSLNPLVPPELEVVLRRALEKTPARRYATAAELRDEIRRIRHHEPIRTRAPGPVLRLRRWTQRDPVAATFLVLLSLGLAVTLGLLREINAGKRETLAALDRARALALVGAAAEAVQDDPPLALRFALEALKLVPDLPEGLSEVHRGVAEFRQVRTELDHGDFVASLAMTADGQRALSAGMGREARLWDLEGDTEPIAVFGGQDGHQGHVTTAAFSPDARLVATGSRDKSAKLWEASSAWLCDMPHPAGVHSVAFHPVKELILTGCDDGRLRLWDFEGRQLDQEKASRFPIRAVFSPDGERILTFPKLWDMDAPSFDACTARLWELHDTEAFMLQEVAHDQQIHWATFSPDGRRILTASWDQTARLWNGLDGSPLGKLEGHGGWVTRAAFSADGERVLSCSDDHTARLWSVDGELLHELRGHSFRVLSAAFSPDPECRWMVTGGNDNTARVWDEAGRTVAVLRGHRGGDGIWQVAFVPHHDPPRVITASQDGTIRLWDLWDPKLPVLIGHEGGVQWADFSPDGQLVATASDDGTVRLWNRAGHCVRVLRAHQGAVWSVRFSPDGGELISASGDGTALRWEVATGRQIDVVQESGYVASACYSRDGGTILTVAYGAPKLWTRDGFALGVSFDGYVRGRGEISPDGKRVLVPLYSGLVRLYGADGRTIEDLAGHEDHVPTVAYDSSGRFAVTAGWDGVAIVWDFEADREHRRYAVLEGPELPVHSAQFSPDGARIVTAHADGVARVWTREGALLAELPGHRASVQFAMFSPKGDRILTCSNDGTARFWFAEKDELLGYAQERKLRDFSPEERARYADLLEPK